ncbi:hypothetical protein [Thiohalocapsa sp.]|uniref:hypothetical protein n=1 Tax=Thiohalocapsa sp. TaxID=2497641 RepID=UPI0025CC8B55|nr:hypothetical protein [Thiohalocapsa sp.]
MSQIPLRAQTALTAALFCATVVIALPRPGVAQEPARWLAERPAAEPYQPPAPVSPPLELPSEPEPAADPAGENTGAESAQPPGPAVTEDVGPAGEARGRAGDGGETRGTG